MISRILLQKKLKSNRVPEKENFENTITNNCNKKALEKNLVTNIGLQSKIADFLLKLWLS